MKTLGWMLDETAAQFIERMYSRLGMEGHAESRSYPLN